MIELLQECGEVLLGFMANKRLGDYWARLRLRSGAAVLVIGICLVLGGCARELTPYGRARQADTIEAYQEFMRNNPQDPRVRYARQRIEVLRVFDVRRSDSAGEVGAGEMAPRERAAERAAPRDVPQGPWNLARELPRSSTFTLNLQHGGAAQIPHWLRVSQEGERVTYTLEYGNESRLEAIVPLSQFARLWETVVSSDVGSMRSSYGRMASAVDYRGYLVIEIDTGSGRFSREIWLEGLNFQDETLKRLLNSMTEMHPKDHKMSFFR